MEPRIQEIFEEYHIRSEAEAKVLQNLVSLTPEEMHRRIDEFLICVGPATGSLINTIIKESKGRSILEVGTSYGYSTIWLAEAARETGGKVTTLEIHPGKIEFARKKVEKAGLGDYVDFRQGDALSIIPELSGNFDFVLLDLWKDLYVPCLNLIYPKLNPGALIVADNIIHPESARKDALEYQKNIRSRKDITSVLLPVGSGIELSRFC
ncbi:MAG: O-methyltransferase [Candidatus Riflebacteria bacterium]|nr:O-methyltransferase [Candidatus Riflebacteria bacterium]